MGSKSTAAFMGDITSDSKGTDNMPMAGKPPLDNPTRKAPTLASPANAAALINQPDNASKVMAHSSVMAPSSSASSQLLRRLFNTERKRITGSGAGMSGSFGVADSGCRYTDNLIKPVQTM